MDQTFSGTEPSSAAIADSPLRSIHTSNFPDLLRQLGISLLVSTYQAGKLIVLRAEGDRINTHFRAFPKPMGIAHRHGRFALGSGNKVLEFCNVPAAAPKVEPPGTHDACYLLRSAHVTGDIDIHEMAWGLEGLWLVNTRFSCLCTLDNENNFVPRWQPNFVKTLTPEDCCHLNGLGMKDGRPQYVTALGTTHEPNGWRSMKSTGGVLMDVRSNTAIASNLSMPHSPRWYGDRLWVLESGKGSLAQASLRSGQLDTVTQLPGFTRGLDFWGSLAFIGLSQVRESVVFSGIPLTEHIQDQERICGVWVVHIETGHTIAFLKFEDAVQEIFSVQVVPHRFPEVANENEAILNTTYVIPDLQNLE
jgi:uncharacterized protein (TIGR03032 family)